MLPAKKNRNMAEPYAARVRFTDKQQRNAFSIVKNCDNDWFTTRRGATEKPRPVGVPVTTFSLEAIDSVVNKN